jgi:hypothetical protein
MHPTENLVRRNNHFGINVFPNMNKRLESRNTQLIQPMTLPVIGAGGALARPASP